MTDAELINDLRHIAVIHTGRTRHGCILAAAHRIEQLLDLLDQAQLADIEARNPGIDMDQVRHFRATGQMP